MEGSDFLLAGVLFLFAAVAAVPLASRLGIGAVLGYLLAGIAIGPWGLGFISDVDEILHFSELGVVFLMFIIGLELNPSKLWQLRRSIFGVGAAQVLLSAALLAGLLMLTHFSWQAAVGGGLQWQIGDSFRLFGEYYYSPDSLSSGIKSYEEANAGARYTIMRPVSIEAGYRYLNLAGKNGNRDNAIADGPYVGVNASF